MAIHAIPSYGFNTGSPGNPGTIVLVTTYGFGCAPEPPSAESVYVRNVAEQDYSRVIDAADRTRKILK